MANNGRQRRDKPRRETGRSSSGRRSAIIGILMIAAAVLVLLALVSYDPYDEATADVRLTDLVKVLTGDAQARAKADTIHNWLGLAGAILSDTLIKSTVGYSVFVLPILLAFWGWTILRRSDTHKSVVLTNYAVIAALLVSASFGLLRLLLAPGGPGMEWSGVVGDFLSLLLAQLVGKPGAAVVLLVALLITVVLAVDLDIHDTIERLRRLWLLLLDWSSRRREAFAERRAKLELHRHDNDNREEDDLPPAKSAVKIARPPGEEGERTETPAREPVKIAFQKEQEDETPEETPAPARTPVFHLKPHRQETHGPKETPEAPTHVEIDYVFPSVDLLDSPRPGKEDVDEEELKANAELLRQTLAQFDVEVESVSVTPGPVVTLYELVPASGVKISRIVSLENDIALKLAAKGIRIMAPIPGKSAVGVEIPNSHRSLVTIRSILNSNAFRETTAHLPLGLGKTISGEVFTDDLSKMPHLLIAGSTGSGKSVGINTIIASLLYRMHPSDLKMVIVDPKKIEMAQYAKLKNHFLAISPDAGEEIVTTPHSAVLALRGVEIEMEKRYDRLASAGVRNIVDYNARLKQGRLKNTETVVHTKMPYLIVIIDELADLMITAAREVEEPIARLAQLARAVGIHLIVATQRPSVDVITGVIKANFPARIAYQVASKTDSRTILDMNGAEQLLGNGDMLYLPGGSPKPVRLQNAFVSADEVDAIVDHVAKQQGYASPFFLPSLLERKKGGAGGSGSDRDELFEEAARLIVRHQQGSVSLLQRRLKVGYSRAARLVDELESAGIVGPFDGSKAREVLVESEAELDAILSQQ
jgi:DNA segregation ATPase FtsK/SpoIIIE, S-DNA-T family